MSAFHLDAVRDGLSGLPEVEESTHFGMPTFKVRGKGIVGFEKGGRTALVAVPEAEAEELAARDPEVYEAVWRNSGKIFVGVRVDLDVAPAERLRELLEHAWRHRAPKRVVAAYDAT